jgi:hypothetical protein
VGNTLDINMGADAKKVIREFERITAENAKLTAQLQKMGEKGKEGGGKVKEGADGASAAIESSIKKIVTWGASFLSVQKIIGEIKAGLDDIAAKRLEAMGKVQAGEFGIAALSQQALGDDSKLQELIRQSNEIMAKRGAQTMDEATGTVFALESSGMNTEANRQLLIDLYAELRGQTAQFAKDASGLIFAFGEEQVGDLRDVASKSFAAAKFSRAHAEELLAAAASNAQGAQLLKWSDEEQMAAVTALSKVMPIERAGTTAGAMALALTKEESMAGKPLPEQLGVLGTMKLSDEQLRGFLGADLSEQLEAALPTLAMKEGGKTKRPFKGLSLKEALVKAGGLTEAETADAFGPLADQLKAALDEKTSFVGKGLIKTIEEIQAFGFTPEQLALMFPRRGVAGFTNLANMLPLVKEIIAAQGGAQSGDVAGLVAAASAKRPELRAPELASQAQNVKELLARPGGVEGLYADRAMQDTINTMREKGDGGLSRFMTRAFMETIQWAKAVRVQKLQLDFSEHPQYAKNFMMPARR